MKKYLIPILILIIIGLVFFYFASNTVEAPKIDEYTPQEIVSKVLTVSTSSKQVLQDGYEIEFIFPVTGESKIDTEIGKTVDTLISTFEDEAKSFLPHPGGEDRDYTLNGSFKNYSGGEYNSFVFLVSVDFGGAHPNHFYKTLTFDKNNDVVSFGNMLERELGGYTSLKAISDSVKNIVANNLGEDANLEMIADGAGPKIENFRNFYIEGSDLVFVFEPYAVAPYAYSTQEARIKLSDF
jgi:hypothetical protein